MLIKQQARMMAELTQLWPIVDRHTAEFTTLRGAVGYIQRRFRWIHRHWDDGTAFEERTYSDDVE